MYNNQICWIINNGQKALTPLPYYKIKDSISFRPFLLNWTEVLISLAGNPEVSLICEEQKKKKKKKKKGKKKEKEKEKKDCKENFFSFFELLSFALFPFFFFFVSFFTLGFN